MGTSGIFRSTHVAKLPSYTGSEVSHSMMNFINELRGVKNTAVVKGGKTLGMYIKTEYYAKRLAKSAENGNIKDTLKNINKLTIYSDNLFSATGSPFTHSSIAAVKAELSNAALALWRNNLSLR